MNLHAYPETTGWWTVLGWQTALASLAFLTGTAIQGAAVLGNSSYDPRPWQGTLIVWASLLCALLANMAGGKVLPRAETLTLVVHVLGFFGIMIPLAYMSEHKSAEEVFLQFSNEGGFATQGLAWFVGMSSCAFALAGGDAAVHVGCLSQSSLATVTHEYRCPKKLRTRHASCLVSSC